MRRQGTLLIAILALAGCAMGEARGVERRAALSQGVVDDAVAYNEAYSGAISGQILLNILRAYNRQPRQYMAMSGFSNAAPGTTAGALSVGGVPLDRLGESWGFGEASLGAERRSAPDYTVTPFSEDDFAAIALRATSPTVFEHYWRTGWNRDLLLFLMVERMDVVTPDGAEALFNSPGTIDADCIGEHYTFGGCAFVAAARALAQATRNDPAPAPQGACPPLAAYADGSTPARAIEADEEPCPIRIVVGARVYTLTLRSLDGMVYYVGELLRRNEAATHGEADDALVARLAVIGPGSYLPEDRVPLFRVIEASGDDSRGFVARVTYAGRRYAAGAPANRFCFDPSPAQRCRAFGPSGDRSGTVLELLSGVLAYNQSVAAVSAPQSSVITTR